MANKNAAIDAAIAARTGVSIDHRKMTVSLRLATGRPALLVKGTGEVTPIGEYYYKQLNVDPPTIYPYEQGPVDGKWVKGFDGKKHLMIHKSGEVTHKGAGYFKHNQDEYLAEYPVREVFLGAEEVADMGAGLHLVAQPFRDLYMPGNDPEGGNVSQFTVGKLKGQPRPELATENAREEHARAAAELWAKDRKSIQVYDMTGESRPAGVARHNHYELAVFIIIWYD